MGAQLCHRTNYSLTDIYANNDWNSAVSFKRFVAYRVLDFIVGNGNGNNCFHLSDVRIELNRLFLHKLSGFINENPGSKQRQRCMRSHGNIDNIERETATTLYEEQ